MTIYFITLFPEEMQTFMVKGLFARAMAQDLVTFKFIDLRQFGVTDHRKVDDYPYGVRRGMLLRVDVLSEAIRSVPDYENSTIIYTCPKGPLFEQATAYSLSELKSDIIFISGYYEGVDERLFDLFSIQRYSIGHFVLSSGDLPCMMMAEALVRLLPGVVGKEASVKNDSIISGVLESPQYTTPREYDGVSVPDVVLSGNHGEINVFQEKQSLKETLYRQPNMLSSRHLSEDQQTHLLKAIQEDVI